MSRIDLDPTDADVNGYRLLTALVVPRPIAWVSTCDPDGRGNLAPHSFFTVVSGEPPMVAFSSLGRKDTLRNIEATGEFVVSVASEPMLEAINASSAPFEHGDDEAAQLDIAVAASRTVRPPRVAASPASLECRLEQVVAAGNGFVVIGRVISISIDEGVLVEGHPEMARLQPVSRLGRSEWGRPPEVFELLRPRSVDDVR